MSYFWSMIFHFNCQFLPNKQRKEEKEENGRKIKSKFALKFGEFMFGQWKLCIDSGKLIE